MILRLASPSVLSLVTVRRFVRVSVLTLPFPPGNFVFFLIREIRENENMCCACVCMYMVCGMRVCVCVREKRLIKIYIYIHLQWKCDYFMRLISENTKSALSYDHFVLYP